MTPILTPEDIVRIIEEYKIWLVSEGRANETGEQDDAPRLADDIRVQAI